MENNSLEPNSNDSLKRVSLDIEQLVSVTQADLDIFKHEQSYLRAEIQQLVKENQHFAEIMKKSQIAKQGRGDEVESCNQLTSEALNNARRQITILEQEKRELNEINECSQRTIQIMEHELNNYQEEFNKPNNVMKVKEKYATIVQTLQNEIKMQTFKLDGQVKLIKELHTQLDEKDKRIELLERKLNEYNQICIVLKEKNQEIVELQDQLDKAMYEKLEYQKSLNYTKTMLEATTKREAIAMRKVQESVILAETAMKEKYEAENRISTYKEEYEQLAENITSVLDGAAEDVDCDVVNLKEVVAEKTQIIKELRQKVKDDQEACKELSRNFDTRHNRLEQKYKDICKENVKLTEEVDVTTKKLQELEKILEINESGMPIDQQIQMQKRYEDQLEHYFNLNKQLKIKYKNTIQDLTRKFEWEMYHVQKKNADLKSQIKMLQFNN